VRAARVATASAMARCVDFVAVWSEQVPGCAELVEALAVGVAGVLVADVVVQRVSVVGDLLASVVALGGAQQRGLGAAGRNGCCVGEKWWPDIGAGVVAGRGGAGVLFEEVEGATICVGCAGCPAWLESGR
jgi:hypothetical protein